MDDFARFIAVTCVAAAWLLVLTLIVLFTSGLVWCIVWMFMQIKHLVGS
jgi:hypothetical protein